MHSDNQLIRKIKKKNDRGAADKLLGRYYREINRIHFESNLEDTFLLQMIDYYRESLKEGPGSFGVAGEDVQETIREEYGSGYSQNYINRMTELCTRQEISLLLFFPRWSENGDFSRCDSVNESRNALVQLQSLVYGK